MNFSSFDNVTLLKLARTIYNTLFMIWKYYPYYDMEILFLLNGKLTLKVKTTAIHQRGLINDLRHSAHNFQYLNKK